MDNIFDLADKLKELKQKAKELKDEEKRISEETEKVEQEMAAAMVEEEIQNFSRGCTLFYLNTKTYASANPEKKQELFTALKEQGYGDLVYETVNSNSLSAFVKEQIEQNEGEMPEWLDGLVNTFDKTTIGMRKAAK